jgi:cell fate (sporulation/competence/biofilm development) regulator YlbF (YheA/YmcA/DUF963 family)
MKPQAAKAPLPAIGTFVVSYAKALKPTAAAKRKIADLLLEEIFDGTEFASEEEAKEAFQNDKCAKRALAAMKSGQKLFEGVVHFEDMDCFYAQLVHNVLAVLEESEGLAVIKEDLPR